ncbi:MAG TPA: hypothetical protein VGJ26_11275 [Pirellulales bacterium]
MADDQKPKRKPPITVKCVLPRCPECGCLHLHAHGTKRRKSGVVRRYTECLGCKYRFYLDLI